MFKDILRQARESAGLSQKQVADMLKIPDTTYRNYENTSREPDFNTLVKLAYYLGVSTDYLLGYESKRNELNAIKQSESSNENKHFAERLCLLRNEKGLKQWTLAEILGLTRGQISNYEIGSSEPSIRILQKIAAYFGVSTDYLLGYGPNSEIKNPHFSKGDIDVLKNELDAIKKAVSQIEESYFNQGGE